jgi:hypothetical protein
LTELDHCFGELEISKRIAAGAAYRFQSGFEEWMVRDAER